MAEASAVASASSSGADEGFVLVLDASLPNLAPSAGRRGRKNLPKEAYNILKDYFFNVNQSPKKHERLELAAKVNNVSGGEAYTHRNVEHYFVSLRKRHRQTSTVVVKRELVEEPLSLGADDSATNGAIVGDGAASISMVPRKKRKSQVKDTTSAPAAQHALSTASTAPSISSVRVAPTSAPSGPARSANQRRWTRLKPEGYKVLSDFFTNVSRYPTAAQKAELLAVVTSMKGCEGYTLQKLTAYFSRLRIERKEPIAFVKAESPDSLSNAAYFPDQEPAQKPVLVARPVEPEPLPPQPFLVLQPESVPPKPFLVLRPAPEPEPASEPEPLLATVPSSPTLYITQSAQPPNSTPLAAPESHFSVFSIFEPVAPVELQVDRQTTGSGPTTRTAAGDGTAEPDPPRHPPKTFAFHPSSLVGSGPAPAPSHTPATQTYDAAEAVAGEDSLSAVGSPSDPTPAPSLKLKLKLKLKAEPEPEPESGLPKRALSLSDAALKMLDDYYTTVTPNPSTSQCATLANQASALPDGGRCTTKQVRKYFKRRRAEAPKAERMGAGAGADEPALVLVAVGEKSDADGPVQETANVETGASELPAAVASSSSPAPGGGDQHDGELAVPDDPMDDVQEPDDPMDDVQKPEVIPIPCSPSPRGKPNQDGECPDDHAQISGEEEWADAGIEADVERAEPEPDAGIVAEAEPCPTSKLDDTLREVPVSDALDDPPTPSPLALSGENKDDDVDEAAPDVSMGDIPGNREPDGVVPVPVPASPRSNRGGECLDGCAQMLEEEALIEADVEHVEPDVELVAEVEPEPNLNVKSYEVVCEVAEDAVLADPVDLSALSSPPSGGVHKDGSGDQPIRDIAMDSLHEDSEDMVPEDVLPGDVLLLDYPQPGPDDADTPMDVDSGTSPTSIEAEVFSLAVQLQRVFSKPSSLDGGHPTTFAEFATWLQTRNAGLLCAPT